MAVEAHFGAEGEAQHSTAPLSCVRTVHFQTFYSSSSSFIRTPGVEIVTAVFLMYLLFWQVVHSFDVSVLSVDILELRVYAKDRNRHCHAVWIDPVLTVNHIFCHDITAVYAFGCCRIVVVVLHEFATKYLY